MTIATVHVSAYNRAHAWRARHGRSACLHMSRRCLERFRALTDLAPGQSRDSAWEARYIRARRLAGLRSALLHVSDLASVV